MSSKSFPLGLPPSSEPSLHQPYPMHWSLICLQRYSELYYLSNAFPQSHVSLLLLSISPVVRAECPWTWAWASTLCSSLHPLLVDLAHSLVISVTICRVAASRLLSLPQTSPLSSRLASTAANSTPPPRRPSDPSNTTTPSDLLLVLCCHPLAQASTLGSSPSLNFSIPCAIRPC